MVFVSTMTPASIISGYRAERDEDGNLHDPSLLAMIDGKVLVIKDFTAVLTLPREACLTVIGMLRDAYDGECSRQVGNLGLVSYKARFSILAACTNIYEHFYSVNQQLGERFVLFRLSAGDSAASVERSLDNMTAGDETRQAAESAMVTMLEELWVPPQADVVLPDELAAHLIKLATLAARFRTHVHRDGRTNEPTHQVQVETGARLVRQLALVAKGRAVVKGRLTVRPSDMRLVKRIARDTLPSNSARILQLLYQAGSGGDSPQSREIKTRDIASRLGMYHGSCRDTCNDLEVLGGVAKVGRLAVRMTDELFAEIKETGLW